MDEQKELSEPIFTVTYKSGLDRWDAFTEDQVYSVYEEKWYHQEKNNPLFYFLTDDNGKKRKIPSTYFKKVNILCGDEDSDLNYEMVNVRDLWRKAEAEGNLTSCGFNLGVFEIESILKDQERLLFLALG